MRVSADGLRQPENIHWTASAHWSMLMTTSWYSILAGTVWLYSRISVRTASNIRTSNWYLLSYRGETVNHEVKQLFQNQPRIVAVSETDIVKSTFCSTVYQGGFTRHLAIYLMCSPIEHDCYRTKVIAAVDEFQCCRSSPAGLRLQEAVGAVPTCQKQTRCCSSSSALDIKCQRQFNSVNLYLYIVLISDDTTWPICLNVIEWEPIKSWIRRCSMNRTCCRIETERGWRCGQEIEDGKTTEFLFSFHCSAVWGGNSGLSL